MGYLSTQQILILQFMQDSLAEWSKALAQGASPQGRGFEPHSCQVGMCQRAAAMSACLGVQQAAAMSAWVVWIAASCCNVCLLAVQQAAAMSACLRVQQAAARSAYMVGMKIQRKCLSLSPSLSL